MWILNKNGPRIEPWGASCDQWGVTHPASLTPAGLHRGRRSRWGAAPPRLLLILLLWQHHPTVEHQQTQCPPQEHPEQRTSAHTHTHTHALTHTPVQSVLHSWTSVVFPHQDLQKVLYVDNNMSSLLDMDSITIAGANSEKGGSSVTEGQQMDQNRVGIRTLRVSPNGKHLASGDRIGVLR